MHYLKGAGEIGVCTIYLDSRKAVDKVYVQAHSNAGIRGDVLKISSIVNYLPLDKQKILWCSFGNTTASFWNRFGTEVIQPRLYSYFPST